MSSWLVSSPSVLSLVEAPNTFMLILRLVLSLGLVLALVGVVTWVLRRRGLLAPGGAKTSTGRLEVLDRKALTKHASLVVARVGGVAVLVGVTERQITVLSEAPGIDAAWNATPEAELVAVEPARADPVAAGAVAESALDLELLMQLPSAAVHAEQTTGARRTGLRVDADAAVTTSSGMSFVEALRELTVRRS